MKLTKREKSYIYDRVKWYGYDLGSTKDFIVKLYFFDEDDYSEDVDGSPAVYYTSMNTLFNILADRGIKYKEVIDINEYLYVEFSSKEIYKYIKYDLYKGRRRPTKKERKAEKRSNKELMKFYATLDFGDLNEAQPFVGGRITSMKDLGIEVTPYEDVDIEDNSITKRIVDNVSKELGKIKDKFFPQKTEEADLEKVEKANSIEKRVYDDINEELKKINEEIGINNDLEENDPIKKLYRGEASEEEKEEIFNNVHKEYHIKGNILMGDNTPEDIDTLPLNPSEEDINNIKELRKEIINIYEGNDKVRVLDEGESVENRIHVDEDGNPERADVRVKMTPENAMLAYIKELANFRRKQTGEDIRVVNEEGEEL